VAAMVCGCSGHEPPERKEPVEALAGDSLEVRPTIDPVVLAAIRDMTRKYGPLANGLPGRPLLADSCCLAPL